MERIKLALLAQNFDGMIKGPGSSPNEAMQGIEQLTDERMFRGLGKKEKLSAYRAADDIVIVQSAGLFAPCVHDAEMFGAVCAAHSLNDIYAVGGEPKVGLNLVGFPNCQDPEILGDILAGGANKVKEAGAVLVGGHTIQDDALKYGLCVTGFVRPEEMWSPSGVKAGDVLVLTKALGSGFIACAAMEDKVSKETMETAAASMATLNRYAVDLIREQKIAVHACAEVAGNGLYGAALGLLTDGMSACLDAEAIPTLPKAEDFARLGFAPQQFYKNRSAAGDASEEFPDAVYCPEISGGLLLAMDEEAYPRFREAFQRLGLPVQMRKIGRICACQGKKIVRKR